MVVGNGRARIAPALFACPGLLKFEIYLDIMEMGSALFAVAFMAASAVFPATLNIVETDDVYGAG